MKLTMNNAAQIYDLQNGELSALNLPLDTDVPELHNEAYNEGFILYTAKSLISNSIVAVIPKPRDYVPKQGDINITYVSANIVANHLLSVLMYGDQTTVTYNGEISLTSVRAMCYKTAKEKDIIVKSEIHNGILCVKMGKKTGNINNAISVIEEGETITLPTAIHTSVARLRSVISNYSKRNNVSFKTKLVNENYLQVYRVPSSECVDKDFKKWVLNQPWDVIVEMPGFDIGRPHKYRICKEALNGAVKIEGKTLIKFSKRIVISDGEVVIIINGKLAYRTGVPRISALTQSDIAEINHALSIFGVSYENLSV